MVGSLFALTNGASANMCAEQGSWDWVGMFWSHGCCVGILIIGGTLSKEQHAGRLLIFLSGLGLIKPLFTMFDYL